MPAEYRIIRHLGRGSYGEVVEARSTITNSRVAIKRMTNIFEDNTDCRRILRELHILRATRGMRGVVQLIEIIRPEDFETFNDIYVVLEYAPCDIKKLVK